MKQLIAILLVITSFSAKAQVDSSKVMVNIGVQVRDWEYMYSYMDGTLYDNMRDSVNARVRLGNQTNQTVVTIGAELGAIWSMWLRLRIEPTYSFSYNRYDLIVRALNIPWINNKINAYDAIIANEQQNQRLINRKRILGQRN